MDLKKILVTGCAGFIGMSLCEKLLIMGFKVLGVDNLNNYYSVSLKRQRVNRLKKYKNFLFTISDISDFDDIRSHFKAFKPNKVINLAAQAGVRYSLDNPHAYINTNVMGFLNILECCRNLNIGSLLYASSSSVYGGNKDFPFSIKDRVDNPISIYAATKKSNELMANSYSHLFNIRTTGLRFFTVYGPWGRPDMAMYIFAKKIMNNKEICVFNNGDMERDFTYIDDIVDGLIKAVYKNYKCEIFNLGNNNCVKLMDVIKLIEDNLGKKAKIKYMGMQPGDVKKTVADIDYSKEKLSYNPKTKISEGVNKFIRWFIDYSQGS